MGYLAVRMANVLGATGITLCTDSWAIYKGLILLLPTWAAKDWMVTKRPLWGKDLRQALRVAVQWETVTVYHVPAHAGLNIPPGNHEANSLIHLRWA